MQDFPLTIDVILRRATTLYPTRAVASRTANGTERTDYAELGRQVRKLAGALDQLHLGADARVGTFAWNTAKHLMLYFGVPCTGRVLHTVNIRYFAKQIAYSINHAEDEAIFVDRSLLPILEPLLPGLRTVRHIVVMDDGAPVDLPDDSRLVHWTDLVEPADEIELDGRVTDENSAAGLCYTTGTTGDPKGVLYSHRSIWLHANAGVAAAGTAFTDRDNVLPVVPMFHAMAWGWPYSAVQAGAAITLPGPDLSPAGLLDLIETEGVTCAGGVPTIWRGMLPLLAGRDLSTLTRVLGGGSAVPKSLAQDFRAATGVPILQAWGMTETSPIASVSVLRAELDAGTDDDRDDARATAGLPLYGVEIRITDPDSGQVQPWDDNAAGELEVRGPWIARQYYRLPAGEEHFTADGWLRTGDMACISPLGYIRLVDRAKDLIKSGGEWISSVDLENHIMAHPDVAESAVIGVPHDRWMERPLAYVVARPDRTLDRQDILDFLKDRVAKWQIPDDIVFLPVIPKTSVGKFNKKELRATYANPAPS
jgi:fatty-acyl-CoA synthase